MSIVTLIELSPRRPSDGVVQTLRFVRNSRVSARFLGQQWTPAIISLPESEGDLGFDGQMFAQGSYPQVGQISIAVGTDDTWPALMWDGAAVAIRTAPWPSGLSDPADGDFSAASPARVESLSVADGVATLTLIDAAQHLRRPVIARRFGSTGNALLDGADVVDRKGLVIPIGWGRMLNVPGILVDRAHNIWLFIDRAAASVQGFYDGGKAFTPGTARADLAALRANTPAAGAIDWALNAGGLVLARPWTAPTYVLTADLTGTAETVADIASAIVGSRTAIGFTAGTVAAFNSLQPAPAGLFVDDERAIGDALNALFAGVGGWWKLNATGTITLGRFGITAPVKTFAAHDIGPIKREAIIAPTRRRAIGWGRNNRVHSEGEIATILLVDDIAGLGDLAYQDQITWGQVAAGGGRPDDGATRNVDRGPWVALSNGTAIAVGDEVQDQGSTWGCILAHSKDAFNGPPSLPTAANTHWRLRAAAGNAGAPGASNYTWIAYADNITGTLNFVTGAPGGRGFQGLAQNKPTATESTDPADYTWAPYAGPPAFGLVPIGTGTISGNSVIGGPGSTGSWSTGGGYSSESGIGAATAAATIPWPQSVAFGLNNDPATAGAGYADIDYCFVQGDTEVYIFESNVLVSALGNPGAPGRYSIVADGQTVNYFQNGTLVRTVAAVAPGNLFFDSAITDVGSRIDDISFIPGGRAGDAGDPGADGADGQEGLTAAGNASFTVATTPGGTPKFGALPQSSQLRVLRGATDLTATATWTVVGTPIGCAFTVPVGLVTLSSSTAAAGSGEVKATLGAVEIVFPVTVRQVPEGSAALGVSQTHLFPTSSSYTLRATTADLPLPAGRACNVTAGWDWESGTGLVTVAAYARYSTDGGGSWTALGSLASATSAPLEPAFLGLSETLSSSGSARLVRIEIWARCDNVSDVIASGTTPLEAVAP